MQRYCRSHSARFIVRKGRSRLHERDQVLANVAFVSPLLVRHDRATRRNVRYQGSWYRVLDRYRLRRLRRVRAVHCGRGGSLDGGAKMSDFQEFLLFIVALTGILNCISLVSILRLLRQSG